MTWSHLWPLLTVMGAGLAVLGVAAVLHVKGGKDSDGDANFGCVSLILVIVGVILVWKSMDGITNLMDGKR